MAEQLRNKRFIGQVIEIDDIMQFLADIKKELKEKANNAESGRYAFLEAIKIIDKHSSFGDEKDDCG